MGKGWLGALLIKNRLHKVQKKNKARNAREPCGVESGPAQGPRWGPGAKPLVGVQGAKPPEAPVHFNRNTAFPTHADTAFPTRIYKRQIVKF